MRKVATLENIKKYLQVWDIKLPNDSLSFWEEIGFFERINWQRTQNMKHSFTWSQFLDTYKNFEKYPLYTDEIFKKYFYNAKKIESFYFITETNTRAILFSWNRKFLYICKIYATSDKKDKSKKLFYVRVWRKLFIK